MPEAMSLEAVARPEHVEADAARAWIFGTVTARVEVRKGMLRRMQVRKLVERIFSVGRVW